MVAIGPRVCKLAPRRLGIAGAGVLVIGLGILLAFAALPGRAAPPFAASSLSLSEENAARADAILAEAVPGPPPVRADVVSPQLQQPPMLVPPPDPGRQTAPVPTATAAGVVEPRATGAQAQFIAAVGNAARSTDLGRGGWIPPSVTIAQAIVESDWGQSQLASGYHNYFGMKGDASGAAVSLPTVEYDRATRTAYWASALFRVYVSLTDSVADYDGLLSLSPRYRPLVQQRLDPESFARGLQATGYATDPWYAARLLYQMDAFDLYRYDSRSPIPL